MGRISPYINSSNGHILSSMCIYSNTSAKSDKCVYSVNSTIVLSRYIVSIEHNGTNVLPKEVICVIHE